MSDRELFHGKCPYTGNPCNDWNCLECEIERQEREWSLQFDDDERRGSGLIEEE